MTESLARQLAVPERSSCYPLVPCKPNVGERVKCQTACKPGSVPPRRRGRGWPFLWDARHRTPRATDPSGGAKARPASREFRDACRSYLVLLPVGFTLPPPLPAARCALTAPFHPCRPPGSPEAGSAVYFLWHFPWGRPRRALPGTAPPWSPDFPLPARQAESGHPAVWYARDQMGTDAGSVKPGARSASVCDGGSPGHEKRRRKASQNKSAVIASRTSAAANASGAVSCWAMRFVLNEQGDADEQGLNRPGGGRRETRRSALRSGRRSFRRQWRCVDVRDGGTPPRTAGPRTPVPLPTGIIA